MGAVQTQPAYPRGLDFEQVWAALMENREQLKESAERHREIDREIDRIMKENAQGMKELRESQKETDRIAKGSAYEIGKLSKRMGEVVEYLVAPDLCEKFKDLGFNFSESSQRKKITDKDNKISFEIDVFLENYSKAMLVEVKTTPTTEDVKDHVKRLGKMRKYADLHGNSGLKSKRVFLGAVAGVVFKDNVRKYILKQGFFIIEPSGEGFNITSPKGKPKEW